MVNVRVTRSISGNSTFAQQVKKVASAKTFPKMRKVADAAVREADSIVADEFVNDRPPERRRSGRHLLGSFKADTDWNGRDFPVTVTLRSSAPGVKLNSLNNGSRPHTIPGNPKLSFPKGPANPVSGSERFVPQPQRFARAYGTQRPGNREATKRQFTNGVRNTVVDKVNHPGTKPSYFLERAIERAVQATYGQAVKMKRK